MSDPSPVWDRAANRSTFWGAVFAEALASSGVDTVCLSPGSRSTPLVLAFAAEPRLRLYNVVDERSAAFFALGHAKASGRPVALLCTSGTAAANFYPAIIEAFHAQVPLIVLTADRPPELRDTGAGQTIDQIKLYGGAVKWFADVGTPEMTLDALRHLKTLAARVVLESTRAPAGPVHLNFPFRKPLEPAPVSGDVAPELVRALEAERATQPWITATVGEPAPPRDAIERLARMMRERPEGLIVCGPELGVHAPKDSERSPRALAELAQRAGCPILADPPSQTRQGPHDRSHVIAHAEAILRAPSFRERLRPQWMLRFGGTPTAKHVEVLLDEHPACHVVQVSAGGRWLEPTHHPGELIVSAEAAFCEALTSALGNPIAPQDTGLARWQAAERAAVAAIAEAFTAPAPAGLAGEWFEGRVFAELAELLPEGALQFTASSMPVRDLDAFAPVTAKRVRHLVNRGANGIDGTLSSALGAAAAHTLVGGPTVLVTGDLAFYHDANGLLAAKQHGLALTVILLNNDGGGIFEMLPVAAFEPPFEQHFGTPHGIDFAALCSAYGIPLHRPRDWEAFRRLTRSSLASGRTEVIEIRTERKRNREQHRLIWEAVARRLEQLI